MVTYRHALQLDALGDATRRAILERLLRGPQPVGELAREFTVSRPAISQHLRVLKEAGLVSERRNGTRRLYRARPESIAQLRAYLESYWDENLRLLKQAAEQEEQQRGTRRDRRHKGN